MEADFQQFYGLDVTAVMPARAARLLFQLPPSSRVINKLHPKSQWGWSEHFANKANFLLETLIWQNSYSKKHASTWKKNKPKPFVPDFLKEPVESPINEGIKAMPTHEIDQWLSLPRVENTA